jgi:hypothetical protein
MDLELVSSVILAFIGIIGSLILFFGFRLLLPFRFLRRPRLLLSERVGPLSLLLCLLWTAALVPAPFVFLWGWLIHFGQALLVDTPRQIGPILPSLAQACSNSTTACLTSGSSLAAATWTLAISQPARAMQVPPGSAAATLVFAIGITAVAIWSPAIRQQNFSGTFSGRTGSIAALALSFMVALYLSITSILAIPIFNETVPELAPLQADLASKLNDLIPTDLNFPTVIELETERRTLSGGILPVAVSKPRASEPAHEPPTGFDTIWTIQIDTWDRTASLLEQDVAAFPKDAHDFARNVVSFFQVSDEGHGGAEATKRHVTVLVNSYNLWIADYRAGIEKCVASLRTGLGQLRMLRTVLIEFARADSAKMQTGFADQLRNTLQKDYGETCNDIKPVGREYLPPRSGPSETLGPFGFASAWLLKTESPELALIVGLLGFGFFGALATSFIREFTGMPGKELPPIGLILRALIRGISAAILVFLLAKGGVAIFTKGDATPNAYAIFFACFVAAVFSEDVWLWARNRQRNDLGSGDDAKREFL